MKSNLATVPSFPILTALDLAALRFQADEVRRFESANPVRREARRLAYLGSRRAVGVRQNSSI